MALLASVSVFVRAMIFILPLQECILFGRSEGVLGLGKSMLRNVLISNGIRGEVHLVKLLNHLIRGCICLPSAEERVWQIAGLSGPARSWLPPRTEDGGGDVE